MGLFHTISPILSALDIDLTRAISYFFLVLEEYNTLNRYKTELHQSDSFLKVLLIEDTKDRQQILTSLYKKYPWILVNTGERALKLLNAYDFDIVSLDYNLGGQLNGADVAKVLKCSRNKNVRVIVHSMNPRGAKIISLILPDAIVYPVAKIVRSNKLFKDLRSKIDELGRAYDWTQN